MCQVHDTLSVRANGPGLQSAVISRPTHFSVLMDGAGRGELDVTVTGRCYVYVMFLVTRLLCLTVHPFTL